MCALPAAKQDGDRIGMKNHLRSQGKLLSAGGASFQWDLFLQAWRENMIVVRHRGVIKRHNPGWASLLSKATRTLLPHLGCARFNRLCLTCERKPRKSYAQNKLAARQRESTRCTFRIYTPWLSPVGPKPVRFLVHHP